MRHLDKIILHCSATEAGKDYTVEQIREWHLARGWQDIGYHYCIYRDGSVHKGRDLDVIGSHTKGQNKNSIGICYIGGLVNGEPEDTMTALQEISFLELVFSLRRVFGWLDVHGHNEFAAKPCPSFNVREKYQFINQNDGILN